MAPEKCTEEEGGAQGHMTAPFHTEKCSPEGPSTCPLRDQGPLEAPPSPSKEIQTSKRPRPQQENPEIPAQKRPRTSAKPFLLAEGKGSASASDQGALNATAQQPCQLSVPGISLKEAADVVVRYLTPFYKEGKFASKVG